MELWTVDEPFLLRNAMTLTIPDPVFKVMAFLKSNISEISEIDLADKVTTAH